MSVGLGLGLVFVRLFRFSILFFLFYLPFLAFCYFLFYSCVVCFCCVRFSFFSTIPTGIVLGSKFPKLPILCPVGRKNLNSTRNVGQYPT